MPDPKWLNLFKKWLYAGRTRNRLLQIALKGNQVECPCCGGTFITFLPAGLQKRANARCIRCGSLERHRSLWLFFREQELLFKHSLRLLHVAPERLFYHKFSRLKNIDYHPVDLNPDKYRYGPKTRRMDVTALDYPDASFDVIICNHVLEHIREDRRAMGEMFRVLKPGGWAVLNVPVQMKRAATYEDPSVNDPQQQTELFGQPDHVRVYGKDYVDRLQTAGFRVDILDFNKKFSQGDQFRYGLKPGELIFYCSK